MRLVLGTAQLGLAYGINNKVGKPSVEDAKRIVGQAFQNGIKEFDTAQGYGDSESVLGKALAALRIADRVRLMSKLNPSLDYHDVATVEASVERSLRNLNVKNLYGLMLHREEMLDDWRNSLDKVFKNFVSKGYMNKVGISVYSPERAKQALEQEGIDFVQLPSSILDRRFDKAGIFELAAKNGKDVYIRSVFMQGLLMMPPEKIPERLNFTKELVVKLKELAQAHHLSVEALSLRYVFMKWPHSRIIFGAESQEQVRRNTGHIKQALDTATFNEADQMFLNVDDRIVTLQEWPR